ncbi:MAG: HAD family hydrolase [Oscillospiraceae bacterium]|nr:HAD family hydrolase [Oscillospiraceae bacterium]
MNLDNIILITDADGTLLTDDKSILETDRAAIRGLIENGGLFTVATGRGVALTRGLADDLNLEIPAVIFNGAAVYDFKREVFLWQSNLPKTAGEYIKLVQKRFPSVGIEILRGDEIYVISTNWIEEKHLELGATKPVRCDFGDVPQDGWIKVLFVDEPETTDKIIGFLNRQGIGDVHMVRSAPWFYEVLPSGVNKGTGFKKLLEILNIKDKYVVAAGDFMNDLEMIQAADLGVAVANAEEIVKKQSDLIVCDNNSGAMREIIEYLKRIN